MPVSLSIVLATGCSAFTWSQSSLHDASLQQCPVVPKQEAGPPPSKVLPWAEG